MSSTICGRCAATALHWTQKRPDDAYLLPGRILMRVQISTYRIQSVTSRQYASSPNSSRKPRPSPQKKSSNPPTLTPAVNAPLSTLPAELNTPPAPASSRHSAETTSQKFLRYIAVGRAYLAFYKTGLKNVYQNYKASLPIRRALGLPSYLPTSPPPGSSAGKAGNATSFQTAIDTLQITRADFQLVRRAAYDVRRMIPFGLLLIICREFTPLIVVAVGDAVTPFTCRIPRQIEKTRLQRAQQKRFALAAVQGGLGSVTPIAPGSAEELTWLAEQFGTREFASTASAEQVLRACATFGLAKSHDRPSFLVPLVYRRRLMRWAEYLDLDDRLIVRHGGVRAMSADEVRIAVDERGGAGIVSGSGSAGDEKEERRWLSEWLARRKIA